jgi:hypothetical protein
MNTKLARTKAVALILALSVLSVPIARSQTNTPEEVVRRFWKMETKGSRLEPNGWYRAAEYFSGRPSSPHQMISVVSDYFSVHTVSVTGNKAGIAVYTREFRKLSPNLLLENVPNQAPNGVLVVPGMWFSYKLTLSDRHWEWSPLREEPREVAGQKQWTIDGFQTDLVLNTDTAIRYLTEMRDKSADLTTRKNAGQTIAILKSSH